MGLFNLGVGWLGLKRLYVEREVYEKLRVAAEKQGLTIREFLSSLIRGVP